MNGPEWTPGGNFSVSRRAWLRWVGLWGAALLVPAHRALGACAPTPPNPQGPFYLPGALRLGEENTAAGKIAAPEHALFREPHPIASVAGAMMYDHIVGEGLDPAWSILVEDKDGRPAVLEGAFGHGRVLIVEPSFERYFSGAEVQGGTPDDGAGRLFENLVAYVGR